MGRKGIKIPNETKLKYAKEFPVNLYYPFRSESNHNLHLYSAVNSIVFFYARFYD